LEADDFLVRVCCFWCGKEINRSPSAISRVNHVFCGRNCKLRFEMLKHDVVANEEEKDKLSRALILDLERQREGYGDL